MRDRRADLELAWRQSIELSAIDQAQATINQGPTEGSGENARAEEEDESAAGDDALPHAL